MLITRDYKKLNLNKKVLNQWISENKKNVRSFV